MIQLTNQQRAHATAAQRAAAALAPVDLAARCRDLGLPAPDQDGILTLRLFGQDVRIVPPDFAVLSAATGQPVRLADRILALHYLQCSVPLTPAGPLITFRDLPGGQFYYGPFCARTVRPLIARMANDLDRLRQNLSRFDWRPATLGDLSAVIHALGRIELTLVYHVGDEESPPAAEILFDACIRRVFAAEDVAALASRICLSLL